jgi:hypothetical protein
VLQRKLLVAIAEQDRQVTEFKACSSTVETRVLKVWKNEILEWEKDPSKHKNPYTLSRKGMCLCAWIASRLSFPFDTDMLRQIA